MSSSETKPAPAPVSTPAPATPNQIASVLVDGLLARGTSDLIKEGFVISIKSVLGLLFLLSAGDIKDFVRSLLVNIMPMIKRSPMYALMLYSKVIDMRKLVGRCPSSPLEIEMTSPTNHRLVVDANSQFLFALYIFVNGNSDCSFKKSVTRANVNNLKDCFTTECLSNICVGQITILNSIRYNINIQTREPVYANISATSTPAVPRPVSDIKSYPDIFNDEQREILCKSIEVVKGTYSLATFMDTVKSKPTTFCEADLGDIIVRQYPSLDLNETIYAIGVLTLLYKSSTNDASVVTACVNQMKAGAVAYFDPNHIHKYTSQLNHFSSFMSSRVLSWKNPYPPQKIINAFDSLFKPPTANSEQLIVEIPHAVKEEDVDILLRQFIQSVCQYRKRDPGLNQSVKIYCLLLEIEITTTEKPNPAYDQWIEKKQVIEGLNRVPNASSPVSIDFSLVDIPPRTISVETFKHIVTNKFLNETRKGLDTLYLKKADMDKLMTSLDQFKNKKEFLANLGLPNKLNILLYGEPGTGKSTAIQAIATYLGRNIYYLDLKNVATNQDLQLLLEYVNKNVQNGGIIVIEDIDAMTDIVLKRREPKALRVDQLISSDDSELSLEYLLNILQGTLTLDDSIFIVTTNHIDHLDPAFYRDGRFDVKIELKLADRHQIQTIYQKFLKRRISEALLQRIPENMYSPATIIYHVKDYIFAPDVGEEVILARFLPNE